MESSSMDEKASTTTAVVDVASDPPGTAASGADSFADAALEPPRPLLAKSVSAGMVPVLSTPSDTGPKARSQPPQESEDPQVRRRNGLSAGKGNGSATNAPKEQEYALKEQEHALLWLRHFIFTLVLVWFSELICSDWHRLFLSGLALWFHLITNALAYGRTVMYWEQPAVNPPPIWLPLATMVFVATFCLFVAILVAASLGGAFVIVTLFLLVQLIYGISIAKKITAHGSPTPQSLREAYSYAFHIWITCVVSVLEYFAHPTWMVKLVLFVFIFSLTWYNSKKMPKPKEFALLWDMSLSASCIVLLLQK